MCDHDDFDNMQKQQELSRRQFGALGFGAGVVAMLPTVANAAQVTASEVSIKTPDGTCDAHFVHPVEGATAAVLVWPDIFGLRDSFRDMGKRLAESGYAVLTVNPFYRLQKAPTSAKGASFQDPATREALLKQAGSLTPTTHVTDAKAFIAWLDAQKVVDKKRKMGTTGYCMGGPMVFRTAATAPGRVGAAATSPHLLIPQMKANFLIAIAANDDASNPESKNVLRKAFDDAKLKAEIEVYAGTQHGWCPPDAQVYNPVQAEKAWGRLLELFKTSLA
jgi:carboxymethylenebutenolidase